MNRIDALIQHDLALVNETLGCMTEAELIECRLDQQDEAERVDSCQADIAQNSEDCFPEKCGKPTIPGSKSCKDHEADNA